MCQGRCLKLWPKSPWEKKHRSEKLETSIAKWSVHMGPSSLPLCFKNFLPFWTKARTRVLLNFFPSSEEGQWFPSDLREPNWTLVFCLIWEGWLDSKKPPCMLGLSVVFHALQPHTWFISVDLHVSLSSNTSRVQKLWEVCLPSIDIPKSKSYPSCLSLWVLPSVTLCYQVCSHTHYDAVSLWCQKKTGTKLGHMIHHCDAKFIENASHPVNPRCCRHYHTCQQNLGRPLCAMTTPIEQHLHPHLASQIWEIWQGTCGPLCWCQIDTLLTVLISSCAQQSARSGLSN